MIRRSVYRFCWFQNLRLIMKQPTLENQNRLKLSVQQLIQSSTISWRFLHRLDQLSDEFNLAIDFGYLLKRVKEAPLDLEQEKQIAELMLKYFNYDENYFIEVFHKLLPQAAELQYATLIIMTQIYLQNQEVLGTVSVLPTLVQSLLAYDDVQLYDLSHATAILTFDVTSLEGEDFHWVTDLQEDIEERLAVLMPSMGQKQFRKLVHDLRISGKMSNRLREAVKLYLKNHYFSLSHNSLLELLHFFNGENDFETKISILQALNLIKIRKVNDSYINKFTVKNISYQEQEMLANLITLSGYQLEREFHENFKTGTNSARRRESAKIEEHLPHIEQLSSEVMEYLKQDQVFHRFGLIFHKIMLLGLTLPELLMPLGEILNQIMGKQTFNKNELVEIINYFETANVKLCLDPNSISYRELITFLNDGLPTIPKAKLLQKFTVETQDQSLLTTLTKLLSENANTLMDIDLYKNQVLLLRSLKQDDSQMIKCLLIVLENYIKKKKTDFDHFTFYRAVLSVKLELNSDSLRQYFAKSKGFCESSLKLNTKSMLKQPSQLELIISSHLKQHLPPQLLVLTNQIVLGSEVDFVIENRKNKKRLYLEVHGKQHYYKGTEEYNYATKLSDLNMSQLENFKVLAAHKLPSQWFKDVKQGVQELISCIL